MILYTYPDVLIAVVEPVMPLLACLKSSSISNTFANKDFEDLSFSSSSFIRFDSRIVFRVIFLPGRPIRKIQGSHWRNTDFICKQKCISVNVLIHFYFFGTCLFRYPRRHFMNIGRSVMVIQNHNSKNYRWSHHEHDAIEVCAYEKNMIINGHIVRTFIFV